MVWDDAVIRWKLQLLITVLKLQRQELNLQVHRRDCNSSRFKSITVAELNAALINGGFIDKQENLVDIHNHL
jgi:hypothetical protein